MSDLKIIGLVVKNFKGIKYAEMKFDPEAGIIKFCGPNNSGKSTIGQVLQFSLFGKKAISDDAVKIGEQNLETELNLGEFKIIRRHPSTKLEIVYPDGLTREKGKQEFLRSLQSEWAFDPSPILNMKPGEFRKYLMEVSGLDLTEYDSKITKIERDRYDIGVEDRALGEIQELPRVDSINVAALLEEKNKIQAEIEAELEEIRFYNQEQKKRNEVIENAKHDLEYWKNKIEEIQEELKKTVERHGDLELLLESLPKPGPIRAEVASQTTTDIDLKILRANDINRDHDNWKRNEEKKAIKAEKKAQYKKFTEKIEAIRLEKKKKLESIDFGIEGLKITESGVYIDGIPSQELSYSGRLRMAWELNATGKFPIKAFFIDTGESLDPEKFAAMEKLAREKGLQFFVTIRTDPGDIPEDHPSNVFYLEEIVFRGVT
jgi:DNA repair exonuclease SbcCD ATPase subunit